MVLKCARDPMFLEEADEAIWRIEVSKYINFCVIKQSVHGTDFVIVFRHYFSGDRKVSRLLANSSK